MVVAITLIAALALGTGFVLQQRAASRAPLSDMLRFRLIWHLMHSPQWLCGIACMVVGQLLSAIALGTSSVTLVEPLLAANLLVALLLSSAISHQRLRRSDWVGALVLGAGLAAFLLAANPLVGAGYIGDARAWVVMAIIVAVAAGLVASSRGRALGEQATMIAGAAGCLAGLQDGFTRTAVLTLESRPLALVANWHAYALVGVGVLVILLQQSAFKAAPLRHALPAVTVAEPLAGIAFGIVAFGDQVRTSWWALAIAALGLAAMIVGVYVVATSTLLSDALGLSRARAHRTDPHRTDPHRTDPHRTDPHRTDPHRR